MNFRRRRLSHEVPDWVKAGSVYHIRIRTVKAWGDVLTSDKFGPPVLESVDFYQQRGIWNCRLFLLMPDHLHALLTFNPEKVMSEVIRNWKRFHAGQSGVIWQDDYFDHRIRSDESLDEKAAYIRNNPVVKGFCEKPKDWPWVYEGGVWV